MLLAHLGTLLSTHAEGICWQALVTPQKDFPWALGLTRGERLEELIPPPPLNPTFFSAPGTEGMFYRNSVPEASQPQGSAEQMSPLAELLNMICEALVTCMRDSLTQF